LPDTNLSQYPLAGGNFQVNDFSSKEREEICQPVGSPINGGLA